MKLNGIENKIIIEKTKKANSWFFENLSKMDTYLSSLIEIKKWEDRQCNERQNITRDPKNIKRIVRE